MLRRVLVIAPVIALVASIIATSMCPVGQARAESPPPFVRSWTVPSFSWGLAADTDGHLLVATDSGLLKYTSSGLLLGTLISTSSPAWDVDVDANGNAYVVTETQSIKLSEVDGTISAVWPYGRRSVALDEARGLIYVHQFTTDTVFKLSMTGSLLGQWGAHGVGIDVASDGSVVVAGYDSHDVYRYSSKGKLIDSFTANPDGDIFAIAVAPDDTIYTVDSGAGHDVRKFSIGGTLLTQWGTRCETPGDCGPTEFGHLRGVAVDCTGDVFVSDPENGRIVQFGSGAGCQKASPSHAAGANVVVGHGERANAAFSLTAVFTPSGKVNGWARVEVPGLSFAGPIACGSVDGNIAVVGGTSNVGVDFVLMLSDDPDGIIVGTGRPDCDTTGFGDPASLPLSSGFIKIIGG